MKNLSFFLIFALCLVTSAFSQSRPNLSDVVSLNDAKNRFDLFNYPLYTDSITTDDVRKSMTNLYYLGRHLGMSSMEYGHKYHSYNEIKVSEYLDVVEYEMLMDRIATRYKCLHALLVPFDVGFDESYWNNFHSVFFPNSQILFSNTDLICAEYTYSNIEYILLHNSNKLFAFDITIFGKEEFYNEKKGKKDLRAAERHVSILPNSTMSLYCSVSDCFVPFYPSTFRVDNKKETNSSHNN